MVSQGHFFQQPTQPHASASRVINVVSWIEFGTRPWWKRCRTGCRGFMEMHRQTPRMRGFSRRSLQNSRRRRWLYGRHRWAWDRLVTIYFARPKLDLTFRLQEEMVNTRGVLEVVLVPLWLLTWLALQTLDLHVYDLGGNVQLWSLPSLVYL
ncbi:unnamed protein product [Symbiodinium microadriaticum]|nr:unnamed protein product [Symbiodinium sp. KB8]CAE7776052.1 unnamed protein product [Symbiodinium microadriaticum]